MHNWKGEWMNKNWQTLIQKGKITNLDFNDRGVNRKLWYLFKYLKIYT